MKRILIPILAAFVTVNIALLVFSQTNTPPTREFHISVSPSTNLFGHDVRGTVGDCTLSPTTWLPIPTYNVEVWSTNGPSPIIVAKFVYTPTEVQLKSAYNAPDPKAVIMAAVLAKVNLTAKP